MNSIFRLLLLSTLLVAVASTLAAPIKPPTEPVAGFEKDFEIAPKVMMRFCWVPSGETQLGIRDAEYDAHAKNYLDDEAALRGLKLMKESAVGKYQSKGFWLGKFEVVQKEYQSVTRTNPSAFQWDTIDTTQHPVDSVCWDDCQAFIKKCQVKGFKVKLPTKNEWEYAYRGGKGNNNCYYWGNSLNGDCANCNGQLPFGTTTKGKESTRTKRVGSYEAIAKHPWGLCDMSGNVGEWCEDIDPSFDLNRANKGGCWSSSARGCTGGITSYQLHYAPWAFDGFRVMLVPES